MFYFVDESGHDLRLSPCAVLAGVALAESDLWSFAKEFSRLKSEILGISEPQTYDAKGSKLLTRRVFSLASQAEPLSVEERRLLVDSLHAKNANGESVSRRELAALAQAKLSFVSAALDLADRFRCRLFLSIVPRDAPRQGDDSFLRKDFFTYFRESTVM